MSFILWLKAFHIVAVVTWFAGLLYLPRLLVYHAEATEQVVRERLKVMERRLRSMTWQHVAPDYFREAGWLHIKLGLVLLVILYNIVLARLVKAFARDEIRWSPRALRIFNEIPALLLIGIVILAVVKP